MANATIYVIPFLTSFLVSVVALFCIECTRRRFSSDVVKRFGGIAIVLAFLSAVLIDERLVMTAPIIGMMIGAVAIVVFGVWDDIARLNWKIQAIFQISLGVLVFSFGMRIASFPIPFFGSVFFDTLPFGDVLGFALLLAWIVFLINVLNWSDGADGLLSSLSIVSFSVIFLLSQKPEVYQPPIGILSIIIVGASCGLLVFNLPPARLFAGTSGSFFLGFALATISVLSGTKIATALLALSLPAVDAVWVLCERLRFGASPFHGGDSRHVHARLREIGWTNYAILLLYALFTVVVGTIALATNVHGKMIAFGCVFFGVTVFLWWLHRKISYKEIK